jgi:hypothetical protein
MRPGPWLALFLLLAVLAGVWPFGLPGGPAPPAEIRGQVVDGAGPLEGAHVRFRGGCRACLTDRHGRFRLPRPADSSGRILAAKEGHLIQAFAADRLPPALLLPRLPAEDNDAYAWVEPGPEPAGADNCVNCHRPIYREWDASAHARSAVNRRFLGLVGGTDWHGRPGAGWNLRADNPDGVAVCTACHAPTVSAGSPAFDDLRLVRGVERRGVHCDFCHKVADATADERGLTFGRFGYRLRRPDRGQLFFGPLDDAERPGESFSLAPVYRDSRYCASCHEGVVFGVPAYTTYSEWRASPARQEGKHCQSCHMAPTGRLTNIAPAKGGIERDPWTLADHRFPGGSGDMLRACLSVSVHLTPRGDGLLARAEVRADNVGHRVPTGFIDRNLLLVVEALDRAGKLVPLRSGPALPRVVGPEFAGKPGRLYAKRLTDEDSPGPVPFWRPHTGLVDTRLEPRRPDKAEFSFAPGVERVRVRLLYRRFWQEVADRKGWPANEITVVDQTWSVADGKRPPIPDR